MVKYSSAALDATFGALADATRRAILAQLSRGEFALGELAAPHRMSLPAVQKHLRVLEDARLVETRKDGRVRRCKLDPQPLRTAAEWIRHYQKFWEEQFDALEKFIEEMKKEDATWRPQAQDHRPQSKSAARLPRRAKKSFKRGSTRN